MPSKSANVIPPQATKNFKALPRQGFFVSGAMPALVATLIEPAVCC